MARRGRGWSKADHFKQTGRPLSILDVLCGQPSIITCIFVLCDYTLGFELCLNNLISGSHGSEKDSSQRDVVK